MPRRTSLPSWYPQNSFVRAPGGARPLASDIEQARVAMMFDANLGGTGEWWRNESTATGAPSLEISGGGDGGGIWSGGTHLQDFGGNTNLGSDVSADLTSLRFGEDYPASQVPAPTVEPELPGVPEFTEPGLLPPLQDYELPIPTDDSFLPRTGEPTVQVPRSNASSGGRDLNWMNGLSLGAYLGSPLSYPSSSLSYRSSPVQGGIVTYGGGAFDLTPSGPGHYEESEAGSTWVEDRSNALANPGANATTNLRLGDPFDERANMESNPDTRANASSNPQEPRERDVIYRDFIDPGPSIGGPMTPEAYRQATFGGVTPTGYRDTRGSAAWDPRAANAMQMWYQSMGGTPNEMSRAIEGTSNMRFYHGDRMRINDEGGFELAGNFERDPFNTGLVGLAGQGSGAPHLTTDPASIRAYNAWIMSQRGRGGNSGVRGIPATSGGGG